MNSHLRLTTEFFLLAHHDYTGRPHINIEVLGTGLAGALIAELVIADCLTVLDDRFVHRGPANRRQPASDPLTDLIIIQLEAQTTTHPVRAWIEYVRDNVEPYAAVRDQLVESRVLRPISSGFVRKTTRYVAIDPLAGAQPRIRLRHTAEHPDHTVDVQTAMLARLAEVSGLIDVIADGANRSVKDGLHTIAAKLPPRLNAVAAGLDAAITMIALSVRG